MTSGADVKTHTIRTTLLVVPQVERARFWPTEVAVLGSGQMSQVQCERRRISVAFTRYGARRGDGRRWA